MIFYDKKPNTRNNRGGQDLTNRGNARACAMRTCMRAGGVTPVARVRASILAHAQVRTAGRAHVCACACVRAWCGY